MSHPIYLTDASFEAEVLQSNIPVLIDFWATWCGPCKMIAPIIEELSDEYENKVKICKLDVDNNPKTAANLGIRSIPTLLIFKNGKPVDNIIGAVPKSTIETRLQAHL